MNLSVSVLIPTIGRTSEVIQTIKALQNQTVPPVEIIVSDQNDPELGELSGFLKSVKNLKHVRNFEKGLCKNYNRLVREASGNILLFLDDDMEIPPTLIESHIRNYRLDEEAIDGVAGGILQPSGDLDQVKIKEIGLYKRWSGKVIGNFNYEKRTEVMYPPGGNMSFRKEVFARVGGFDEGFEGNGFFFEPDFGLRVLQAGFTIVFDPETTARHLMAPRGGARIQSKAEHTFYFVKNGLRLARRHSPKIALPFILVRNFFYVLAKAAYNRDYRILTSGFRAIFK